MGCNGSAALSCCPEKEYVQDKICHSWSVVGAATATDIIVYDNNISQNIVGSGYIRYDVGTGDITVSVLDSAGAVIGTPATLSPGSSLAFTYRRFSQIQLTIPIGEDIAFQGEFCITTRYPLT